MAGSSKKSRQSRKRRVATRRADAERRGAEPPAATPPKNRPTASATQRAPGGKPLTMKASLDEAPPAPWHPIPLTEILIFVGLVLVVVGLVTQRIEVLGGGLLVVAASSTELSAREHFAGYRSHSSLLAGVAAIIVSTLAGIALGALDVGIPVWSLLIVAAVVFAVLFWLLRRAFRNRTGGLSFRV